MIKVGDHVIPKIVGLMERGDPPYIVTEISEDKIFLFVQRVIRNIIALYICNSHIIFSSAPFIVENCDATDFECSIICFLKK